MRIAVLIAGDYREFEHAYKSWRFLDYKNIDTYISTWTISEVRHKFLNIHKKQIVTEDRIRKIISSSGITLMEDSNWEILNHAKKMLGHWNCCITMMNNSGRTYDAVLLIRPDLFLKIHNDFITFIENMKNDVLYAVSSHVENEKLIGVQDQFFSGSQEIISRLLLLPKETYPENATLSHHQWFTTNIGNIFPIVEDMRGIDGYCICRANTTPEDLTFEQVREKTKSWWEALDPTGQSRYLG